MQPRIAGIFLLTILAAFVPTFVHADMVVSAPPSLAAAAARVRSVDVHSLADALARAGLALPPQIRVALLSEDDGRAQTTPRWIVGLAFGDRDIEIFPDRVISYPYDSLESVVRHEVAHLALDVAARGAPLPRWFHEGVATSVDSGWKTAAQLRLLLAMVERPDTAELTRLFVSPSESETTQAYLLSTLLVHELRERHGPAVPGAIAHRVATGVPFTEAFQLETGVTPDAAAAEAWSAYRRWTEWVPAVTSPSAAWTLILALSFVAFVAQRRRRARRRRRWDAEEPLDLPGPRR
jgi:hypothetical protein